MATTTIIRKNALKRKRESVEQLTFDGGYHVEQSWSLINTFKKCLNFSLDDGAVTNAAIKVLRENGLWKQVLSTSSSASDNAASRIGVISSTTRVCISRRALSRQNGHNIAWRADTGCVVVVRAVRVAYISKGSSTKIIN